MDPLERCTPTQTSQYGVQVCHGVEIHREPGVVRAQQQSPFSLNQVLSPLRSQEMIIDPNHPGTRSWASHRFSAWLINPQYLLHLNFSTGQSPESCP